MNYDLTDEAIAAVLLYLYMGDRKLRPGSGTVFQKAEAFDRLVEKAEIRGLIGIMNTERAQHFRRQREAKRNAALRAKEYKDSPERTIVFEVGESDA